MTNINEENDFVMDTKTMERLIHILENDTFYTMPRGLTREERRAWVKSTNKEEDNNDLRVDN